MKKAREPKERVSTEYLKGSSIPNDKRSLTVTLPETDMDISIDTMADDVSNVDQSTTSETCEEASGNTLSNSMGGRHMQSKTDNGAETGNYAQLNGTLLQTDDSFFDAPFEEDSRNSKQIQRLLQNRNTQNSKESENGSSNAEDRNVSTAGLDAVTAEAVKPTAVTETTQRDREETRSSPEDTFEEVAEPQTLIQKSMVKDEEENNVEEEETVEQKLENTVQQSELVANENGVIKQNTLDVNEDPVTNTITTNDFDLTSKIAYKQRDNGTISMQILPGGTPPNIATRLSSETSSVSDSEEQGPKLGKIETPHQGLPLQVQKEVSTKGPSINASKTYTITDGKIIRETNGGSSDMKMNSGLEIEDGDLHSFGRNGQNDDSKEIQSNIKTLKEDEPNRNNNSDKSITSKDLISNDNGSTPTPKNIVPSSDPENLQTSTGDTTNIASTSDSNRELQTGQLDSDNSEITKEFRQSRNATPVSLCSTSNVADEVFANADETTVNQNAFPKEALKTNTVDLDTSKQTSIFQNNESTAVLAQNKDTVFISREHTERVNPPTLSPKETSASGQTSSNLQHEQSENQDFLTSNRSGTNNEYTQISDDRVIMTPDSDVAETKTTDAVRQGSTQNVVRENTQHSVHSNHDVELETENYENAFKVAHRNISKPETRHDSKETMSNEIKPDSERDTIQRINETPNIKGMNELDIPLSEDKDDQEDADEPITSESGIRERRVFDFKGSDKMFDSYFTGRVPTLDSADLEGLRGNYQQESHVEINEKKASSNQRGNVPSPCHRNTGQIEGNDYGDANEDSQQLPNVGISRTPTSTRKIKELINEMNAPTPEQRTAIDKTRKTLELNGIVSMKDTNNPVDASNSQNSDGGSHLSNAANQDQYGLGNSSLTLRQLNAQSTQLISKAYIEGAATKYDALPHIQNISKYTVDQNSNHTEGNEPGHENDENKNRDVSPIITDTNDTYQNNYDADDDNDMDDDNMTISTVNKVNTDNRHQNSPRVSSRNDTNLRTSSANDLREMIEVARNMYKDTDGTVTPRSQNFYHSSLMVNESSTEGHRDRSPTSTVVNTKIMKSADTWKTAITPKNATDELTCSRCLQIDMDISNAGYCKQCKDYLCNRCIRRHKRLTETKDHEITNSYCANELKTNRYVKSIGFCTDCRKFLCMKCIVNHSGFQEFRHHKIVQAPVIMKPTAERKVKAVQGDETYTDDELSDESGAKRPKKKRQFFPDIYKNNPYRLNYAGVTNSVYPSPYKELPMSFTSKPKWPFSSVPTLPYLIQPKSKLVSPYVPYNRAMYISKPRKGKDPRTSKMASLEKRYREGASSITPRRMEHNAFTVRPLEGRLPRVTAADSCFSSLEKGNNTGKQKLKRNPNILKNAKYISEYCLSIPFPSGELQCDISGMTVQLNGKLIVADKRNNNIKLYNGRFECRAVLQFANRLVDICSSNICPTDVYAATPKYIYEVSVARGMEMQRKIKVEIKRIEGLTSWKYGLAVINKKSSLTWELRLLDYRGNVKSKLEILNPFSHVVETSDLYHLTTTKGGKCVVLTDTKNACIISVDVLTRCVQYETVLDDPADPSYLASDNDHNVFVSNPAKVCQLTKGGKYQGTVVHREIGGPSFGCIAYNERNDRLYVQTGPDMINVYKLL